MTILVIMNQPGRSINLSAAKSGLSEIIRTVRRTGESIVITVDGEPAARIAAITPEPRRLTRPEMATARTLLDAIARIPRPGDAFDAAAWVAEGRR